MPRKDQKRGRRGRSSRRGLGSAMATTDAVMLTLIVLVDIAIVGYELASRHSLKKNGYKP